ncbi:helix-turn-helix domain-containing protein [Aquiflexum sp.]|uniref:AraC family transcriptional regulator n=1 Tax=Aquiflexum sp. TaxID=1872584 RepID=UPI0035948151
MLAITSIAISGIAVGLFTLLLIFKNEKLSKPEKLLVFWITALVLNLMYFLLVGPELELLSDSPAIVHIIGIGLVLIHVPVLYVFCSRLFYPKLKILWHSLPFVIYLLSIGSAYLFFDDLMDFRYGFIWFREAVFPFNYYGIYIALVSGIYTFAAFFAIRKQKSMLSQTQSGEVRNVLNWLEYWVMAAIVFFVLTYLVIEFSVSLDQIDLKFTFQVISVFLSIYIIYVSYWAIRKTSAFQHLNPSVLLEQSQKNTSSTLSASELESLAQEIVEIIENEKYYLDPDFSLTTLSNAMNVPSGKLSLAINTGLMMNFYDLINSYRVREFKKRLEHGGDNHLSLLGLAFECGFRSKSTFNAFFKKDTGMTPSSYKKSLKKVSE